MTKWPIIVGTVPPFVSMEVPRKVWTEMCGLVVVVTIITITSTLEDTTATPCLADTIMEQVGVDTMGVDTMQLGVEIWVVLIIVVDTISSLAMQRSCLYCLYRGPLIRRKKPFSDQRRFELVEV